MLTHVHAIGRYQAIFFSLSVRPGYEAKVLQMQCTAALPHAASKIRMYTTTMQEPIIIVSFVFKVKSSVFKV